MNSQSHAFAAAFHGPLAAPLFALALVGCGASGPHTRAGGAVAPLAVAAVDWNPARADVGHVRGVAEAGDVVAVLADDGATIMSARAPVATDKSVKSWLHGAVIPGADGTPQIMGIDARGHLYALRGRAAFDDVSDRFGLGQKRVLAAAAFGPRLAVFASDGEIATADGSHVLLFGAPTLGEIHGAGGIGVGVSATGVYLFELESKTARAFALPGVTHAVLGPGGRIVATTKRAVYTVDDTGALSLVYESDGDSIHGLAAAGDNVWFGDGAELGVVLAGRVAETTGAKIGTSAELESSPKGDVWVIADGALSRFSRANGVAPNANGNPANGSAAANGPPTPQDPWDRIGPVFARACSACHVQNGVAGVDLSTLAGWNGEKEKIHERVIVKKSMPPPGHALSDADREIIRAWTESTP